MSSLSMVKLTAPKTQKLFLKIFGATYSKSKLPMNFQVCGYDCMKYALANYFYGGMLSKEPLGSPLWCMVGCLGFEYEMDVRD